MENVYLLIVYKPNVERKDSLGGMTVLEVEIKSYIANT